jgi:hypothetical protein
MDDDALARLICQACMAGLDVDGAVLSVLTATVSRVTLWATDATAELIEELQFTLNEGACMEAAATGRPVLVPCDRRMLEGRLVRSPRGGHQATGMVLAQLGISATRRSRGCAPTQLSNIGCSSTSRTRRLRFTAEMR